MTQLGWTIPTWAKVEGEPGNRTATAEVKSIGKVVVTETTTLTTVPDANGIPTTFKTVTYTTEVNGILIVQSVDEKKVLAAVNAASDRARPPTKEERLARMFGSNHYTATFLAECRKALGLKP